MILPPCSWCSAVKMFRCCYHYWFPRRGSCCCSSRIAAAFATVAPRHKIGCLYHFSCLIWEHSFFTPKLAHRSEHLTFKVANGYYGIMGLPWSSITGEQPPTQQSSKKILTKCTLLNVNGWTLPTTATDGWTRSFTSQYMTPEYCANSFKDRDDCGADLGGRYRDDISIAVRKIEV